jgi:hypothetical protein
MQVRRRLMGQHDAWPDVVEASLTPSGAGSPAGPDRVWIFAVEVRDKVCRCKRWVRHSRTFVLYRFKVTPVVECAGTVTFLLSGIDKYGTIRN